MKTKKVWILLVFSLFLAGCKSAAFKTSEKNLELRGNPTTGYAWIYTVSDDSVIQVDEDIKYLGDNGIGKQDPHKSKYSQQ